MTCANCECAPVYRQARCCACWFYRRRHKGQERPEALVVSQGRRILEQRHRIRITTM